MRSLTVSFPFLVACLAVCQTVQVSSPRQGRPGEILPWTRFRPRTTPYLPGADELNQIKSPLARLDGEIHSLRTAGANDALLVDVEIFAEAARWVLMYPEEFFRKESVAVSLSTAATSLATK
ncbi:MAG TPA: hypothetical protein VFB63_31965 [Bryobacteraceae bacterium]|nr:hypothetical protein [Bryobacteraceae bacterium]